MARITNEAILSLIDGINISIRALDTSVHSMDKRLASVENVLMSKKTNNSINPMAVLLIKYVVFPLIVVVGGVVGISQILL